MAQTSTITYSFKRVRYFLALVPLLVVLVLMIRQRWGAHTAGMAGWLAGLAVGALSFGLTPQVFWVSQAKGLLLSAFVLAVMWPALFLYHWNDTNGGIAAVARLLEAAIPNRGMCRVLLAWSLSGLLEGLAGFGLPIAVAAPMLAALGVPPLRAVAAVAVGHSWAVTFGDMGVVFQTLVAVVGLDARALVPWAGLLLGVSCLFCGLGAFATGSNNNSNVLFGSLQKNVALFQHINPCILVAAQTAGGSMGSMLAPVKIILGCSTVGLIGQEGRVMRQTAPCGLAIGLALGILTLALCR